MALVVKSTDEFTKKLDEAGEKLVLIDFHATWCGPCKRIAPFVESLAEEYKDKLIVLKADVDEVEELAASQKVTVMPTFVVFLKGKRVADFSGANEEKLKELVLEHLPKA